MKLNLGKHTYLEVINLWEEKPDFFQCTILAIGKENYQYGLVLFNFSFILSI